MMVQIHPQARTTPAVRANIARSCAKIKVSHRTPRPYTPQTKGMVEPFNGRIASEVLGINVAGHVDLEILLNGYTRAYNQRRQRTSQTPRLAKSSTNASNSSQLFPTPLQASGAGQPHGQSR